MGSKTKSPVFPLPEEEPHHFSDYGFDPQIHYFQFLEEARTFKGEVTKSVDTTANLQFKLQKPISKDESFRRTASCHKAKIKKQRWWKNALLFFNLKWVHRSNHSQENLGGRSQDEDVSRAKARALRAAASMSGPVYITESRSGSNTPYRSTTSRRPYSGPLAGTVTPSKGEMDLPYVSLRELNMEQQEQRVSTSAMPIYLVT